MNGWKRKTIVSLWGKFGLFSGANLLLVLGSVGHIPCVVDIVNDEVEAGFLEGMGVLFFCP